MTVATIVHFLIESAILHYMTQSATSLREAKKADTLRRIRHQALVMTRDLGLDGWTMDELADAAGVSRRTLFNYVPGKIDAILGEPPSFPEHAMTVFLSGGPTGRLIDDLSELACSLFESDDFGPELLGLAKQVFATTPRLLVIVHERFEVVAAQMAGHILEREGPGFGARRAHLVVRLMAALFDVAMQELSEDPDGPLVGDHFRVAVADARELLGRT